MKLAAWKVVDKFDVYDENLLEMFNIISLASAQKKDIVGDLKAKEIILQVFLFNIYKDNNHIFFSNYSNF